MDNILDAYLLLKFEEMSIKMLLEPLISIIDEQMFKAIFLDKK